MALVKNSRSVMLKNVDFFVSAQGGTGSLMESWRQPGTTPTRVTVGAKNHAQEILRPDSRVPS